MESTIRYIFILSAILIIAAYAVGVATDTNAFSNGLVRVVNAATGRNAAGNFAAYPGGTQGVYH